MSYRIVSPQRPFSVMIELPLSKSISNRLLLMEALAGGSLSSAYAECDDTEAMRQAMTTIGAALRLPEEERQATIDVGAAGTTMRFLTAYLAITPGRWVLTGSRRMQQRPIAVLVDALRSLGARIDYLGEEGCPPLAIEGRSLEGGELAVSGSISSQYISALLMIGPALRQGLSLTLLDEIVSVPYIRMTLLLMIQLGIRIEQEEQTFRIAPGAYRTDRRIAVEPDWSAASYWYEMVALQPGSRVLLPGLTANSLQGDAVVAELFDPLGVSTRYTEEGVELRLLPSDLEGFDSDFTEHPDLAQTLAVACALKGIPFSFEGVQSLKIKETDRIEALRAELRRLGVVLSPSDGSSLAWTGERTTPEEEPSICTYDDHRMAMAFAPTCLRLGAVTIEHPEVVAKSYPTFWTHLRDAGFEIVELPD